MKLTSLERKVLVALFESSKGNGHDFGFIEDARGVVGSDQLGGIVASLVKKRILVVHEPYRGDPAQEMMTQFVFCDAKEAQCLAEAKG